MTTFIKTKFMKSDDQTNIDKCIRVDANITEKNHRAILACKIRHV